MKQVALIALIMLLISNCVAVYSTPRTDEAFWAVTAKNATDITALAKEDTSGDAANMTYVLMNVSGVYSAHVKIEPDLSLFEVTAFDGTLGKNPSYAATKAAAELYGNYLKQHPDYKGDLYFDMYTIKDGLIMYEYITNGDARSNYAFIDYVMNENKNVIKTILPYDPRSEGISTPMGY